eukprot:5302952-Lingulodinium_polyedra.AAC.1
MYCALNPGQRTCILARLTRGRLRIRRAVDALRSPSAGNEATSARQPGRVMFLSPETRATGLSPPNTAR